LTRCAIALLLAATDTRGIFMRPALAITLPMLFALPLQAQTCDVDPAAVEARIAELQPSYGLVLSDIGCEAPLVPAHKAMCASGLDPESKPDLWQMGRLDDLAWVYAVESATGQKVDKANPPRDDDFLAARDACTDEACLCAVLIKHTNASLGGTSPYPQ
jgi:hypothetical protein